MCFMHLALLNSFKEPTCCLFGFCVVGIFLCAEIKGEDSTGRKRILTHIQHSNNCRNYVTADSVGEIITNS